MTTTDTPNPTQTELDAVRAERAELAARAEARALAADADTLAEEKSALAAERVLDEAQAAHGVRSVGIVHIPAAGSFVLRKPHHAAYRKFQDNTEASSAGAIELVKSCLLYPTKPEFDRVLAASPGILTELANNCVTLAGFRKTELKGK